LSGKPEEIQPTSGKMEFSLRENTGAQLKGLEQGLGKVYGDRKAKF
jgi:hypothetical protein